MGAETVKTILVKAKDQASGTFAKLKGLYDQNRNSLSQMTGAIGGATNASLTLVAASQQNDAQMAANGLTIMANTVGLGGVATATRDVIGATGELFGATGNLTMAIGDAVTWGQNLFNGLVGNQTQMTSYTGTVQALQPQLQAMGVDTQTATAMLAALEAQGITGSAATDMFTNAVNLASASNQQLTGTLGVAGEQMAAYDGSLTQSMGMTDAFTSSVGMSTQGSQGLIDILGLTQEQLAAYDAAATQSTGMTDIFTNAANTQFSMVDRLKGLWGEFGLKVGETMTPFQGVFEKVGMVHNAMTEVGPIVTNLKDKFFTAKDALGNLWGTLKGAGGGIKNVAKFAGKAIGPMARMGASLAKVGAKALISVGGLIASAAAKIWGWASAIPFAGPVIGAAAVAGLIASIVMVKRKMSGFAEGGIAYKPMVANLAEREPEVIAPFSKVEQVFGGGRSITIPIYLDGRRIAKYVVDTVSKQAKLQGAY